jgi:hypothetical protein
MQRLALCQRRYQQELFHQRQTPMGDHPGHSGQKVQAKRFWPRDSGREIQAEEEIRQKT